MATNDAAYFDPNRVLTVAGEPLVPVTLTSSGGNVPIDASEGPRYEVELTEATTQLNNPSNLSDGQEFVILIKQDATGSRALTFGTNWVSTDGITTAVDSTASAVTVLRGHAADLPNGPGLRIYYTLEHGAESAGGVAGPGSSTNVAFAVWSGTGGDTLANSAVTLSSTTIEPSADSTNLTLTGSDSPSPTGSSGTGGDLVLNSGGGGNSGGDILLTGGAKGTGINGGNHGGDIVLVGGSNPANSTNTSGGDIRITGGAHSGGSAGFAGDVEIQGGASAVVPGSVTITGGDALGTGNVSTGPVQLTTLNQTTQGSGGNITVTCGSTSVTGNNSGSGGSFTLTTGSTNAAGTGNGSGGNITLTAGSQTATSGTTNFRRGGAISLTAGNSSVPDVGCDGGSVTITAGNNTATTSSGDGGAISLFAGNASSTSGGFGGDVFLRAGSSADTSASDGHVIISRNSTNRAVPLEFVGDDNDAVSIVAPSAVTAHTLTLPGTQADTDGQALLNDSAGALSWGHPQEERTVATAISTDSQSLTIDQFHRIDTSGGALATVNLPTPAAANAGRTIRIAKTTTDTNTFTLKSSSGNVNAVTGTTGVAFGGSGVEVITAISDGTDWWVG
jgi:hypothetical protein